MHGGSWCEKHRRLVYSPRPHGAEWQGGASGRKRRIWGDVNAALNRLVADGVIAAFKTSVGGPAPEIGAHVIVTPFEGVTLTMSQFGG